MIRHRTLTVPASFAIVLLAAACGAGPGDRLETRTFRLESLAPEAAQALLEPYILSEGATIKAVTSEIPAITVRERPKILDRIEATLVEFDRSAAPAVTLHFQIIEAGTFETPDPRIADVEAALRELFRFEGYRLVGEGLVQGRRFGEFNQQIGSRGFSIRGRVGDIRHTSENGSFVNLDVRLFSGPTDNVLSTQLAVPIGQTFVIGSSMPRYSNRTIILVARPETHQ